MIQLECSNCKTNLSIDDAFAGGVCRCQHCGTIQTVPKVAGQGVVAAAVPASKQLFKRKARIESALSPYSDSLDRAADEIDSSGGLSASTLANLSGARRTPSPDDSTMGSSGSVPSDPIPSPQDEAAHGSTASGGASEPAGSAKGKPHYVPRPSSSAGAPVSDDPAAAASRKTMLIGVAAIVAMIVLGGGAWFAFSGVPEEPSDAPAIVTPAE